MADINIAFSRELLKRLHADVKAHLRGLALANALHLRPALARAFSNIRTAAWVYHAMGDTWEFHGPEDFYWHGSADNAYDARAKGWTAWLRHAGAEGYC